MEPAHLLVAMEHLKMALFARRVTKNVLHATSVPLVYLVQIGITFIPAAMMVWYASSLRNAWSSKHYVLFRWNSVIATILHKLLRFYVALIM